MLSYLPKYFTTRAIILYIIILIICALVFPRPLPFVWVVFGLLAVIPFFYYGASLSLKWMFLPEKTFIKKVFYTALIIRLIYVFFIYFFYMAQTGESFDFVAGDSKWYHGLSIRLKNYLFSGNMDTFQAVREELGVSDQGFPMYLTLLSIIFGEGVLIPRILNALFSAWMTILIYKIAVRNFDERVGKIAAILSMLLPNFIYYTGVHLKETLMVFLLVAFAERADAMIREKTIRFVTFLWVALLGLSLFYFRTVLGAAAVFSFASAILFTKGRVMERSKRFVGLFWILILGIIIASSAITQDLNKYMEGKETNQDMSLFQKTRRGQSLAQYGSRAVFLPMILVAPFPTLVNTDQPDIMMRNGAMFTRNVYAFFVILALILILKRKLVRLYVLILVFLLSYLFILASSAFAISERFHMPVLPFLTIFAAYGITQINQRNQRYFLPYLILIGVAIIGWNWFKLAGRGVL